LSSNAVESPTAQSLVSLSRDDLVYSLTVNNGETSSQSDSVTISVYPVPAAISGISAISKTQ
jgi:hypothetical protein